MKLAVTRNHHLGCESNVYTEMKALRVRVAAWVPWIGEDRSQPAVDRQAEESHKDRGRDRYKGRMVVL